jgi:uncharacterized protein YabN with tetrapyrrole methylase and pyrophosphatase domain
MSNIDPHIQDTLEAFTAFASTVAQLRHPETGGPWDLVQTHNTLQKHMLEEAYEAVAEMAMGSDPKDLCEELGDVLLQVFLHAQLAREAGTFSLMETFR